MLSGTVFSLVILGIWGKFSDRYGNYKIMYITSAIIPLTPLLWILNNSPIYLILVPSLLTGVSWAGFNLATNNFIYDNVKKEKRGTAISYSNIVRGIGIFLGAGLGALLIKFLRTEFINPLFLIFIIGSLASMVVVSIGIAKVKEIRKTAKFPEGKKLGEMIFREVRPTLIEEIHEITSIRNYLR